MNSATSQVTVTDSTMITSLPTVGPDRSQRSTFTRRGFLGTLAAVALGTVTGCSMGGGSDLQEIGGGTPSRPGKPVAAGDNAPYAPTQPYQLSSTCELSEDYFLVQNHLIDPDKDLVVAYSRADGLVEAIVLQDGIVKQIYRDPTQAGGWKVLALPDTQNVTSMAAAVSDPYHDPKRASLHVYYTSPDRPDQLTVASQSIILPTGGAAPTFSTETVPWHHAAGPLQVTLNADNTPLVAAMVPSTAQGKADARLYYCTDCRSAVQPDGGVTSWTSSGYLTSFEYFVTPNSANIAKAGGLAVGWSAIVAQPNIGAGVVPWLTLYLPSFAYSQDSQNPVMRVWAATLMAGRLGATAVKDWRTLGPLGNRAAVPEQASGYVASVEFATVLGSTFEPTVLVRLVDQIGQKIGQRLSILTRNDSKNTWTWTQLALPDPTSTSVSLATATRPVPAGENGTNGVHSFLDLFLVSGATLSVIRQAPTGDAVKDGITPSYTPVLPLQDHVALMTSQPGVSTGNELMLVGADGTLQTLENDPVSGAWTDTVLHLPANEMQQDSAYRVTLTLADSAWNMPVAGQDLKITASAPAVASIEGPSPRTVVLGADAVTVTTASDGQATLALLATGLSAPTLTITGSGLPTPITVYPSGPVNAYMQGATSLNYLQPMSADTLTRATTPDGQTVAPGAADAAAAKEAAANMKDAADWAASGIKSGRVSTTVRRRDGVLTRRHGVGAQDLGGVLDHWAQDALHAIKKGAVAVKTITKDAEHKAFVFATDVANWTDHEITIAVQGIEDAAHVLHAVFNKLAGDIVHAVKWLEAEVIGVFRSAKVLSDRFEQWIGTFSGFAEKALVTEQSRVLGWLKGEQQWVTTELTTLADRYSPETTLSTMAQNPPGPLGARRRTPSRSKLTARPGGSDDQQPAHGDWFYNKIKHELAGSGLKIDLSNTPDLKAKITSFGQKSLTHSVGFQNRFVADFWKGFLSGVVHHPDDVNDVLIQPLLQALLKVVNDAFDYAENVVAEAFDLLGDIAASIPNLLNDTTLKSLPVLGALMKLIGLGDVSIGRVANLIFAFPAALVYKIAHGANAQPFATTSATRRPGTVGDVGSDLQICAASVMGTWAVFDTISAAFVAGGDDGGILFNAIDIAAPLIVTILTTPAARDGEPFFAPPVSGDAADVLGFLAWILGAIPAFCAAVPLVIEKFFVKDQGAKDMVQMTVWFQSLTGVLALVFGMVANSQKDTPKGADYAGATLNNMPTIAGAGLSDVLIEATVGISVVVAMALTLICGELGAVVFGVDG